MWPGAELMLVRQDIGFQTRGFVGPNIRSGFRNYWSGGAEMHKASTGMATRAFGVPVYERMQDGACWCPPEKGGAMLCRNTIAGTGDYYTAALTAIGIILSSINGAASMTNSNLAGGINASSSMDGTGSFADADFRGKAVIDALIRIGADPSAEDIVFALMDTNAGNIESSMTLRQALKVLLAVAAGKTSITDLGGGSATVKFRDIGDSKDVITADMEGSERTTVTLNKS
jgi:hypothetical protein